MGKDRGTYSEKKPENQSKTLHKKGYQSHDRDFYRLKISVIITVLEFEGEELVLRDIRRGDAGLIYCIANNGYPPLVSRQFQIDVTCKFLVI